jgi:hypothetical protein
LLLLPGRCRKPGDQAAFVDERRGGSRATIFSSLMRIALNVSGVLCLLVGCVWILQGINILPGSFMTGQTKWAIYGGLLVVAGIGLLISANRRRV